MKYICIHEKKEEITEKNHGIKNKKKEWMNFFIHVTYEDDLVEFSWCYTQYFLRNRIHIKKNYFLSN